MSCKRIQKLVPLYVEGDLPRRTLERTRLHIADCLPCRAQLEAFRASQRWLHAAPAPQVGGAELDQLRRAVWRRIATEPTRSALWVRAERAWVSLRAFAGQPAAAAAAVFVVVLGSVGLSRVAGFGARPMLPSESAGLGNQAAEEHFLDAPEDPAFDDPMDEVASDRLVAFDDSGELGGAETGREAAGDDANAGDSALRIEIQTRDPNVRIIWFSPQEERPPAARN